MKALGVGLGFGRVHRDDLFQDRFRLIDRSG